MKQEFFDLAGELEKNCGDWENSKGMSEETKAALIAKVKQREQKASEGKRACSCCRHFRLKKRYMVVLAASLALLFGMSVVGDRVWIAKNKEFMRETEVTTKVNNEEKDSKLREEEEIYQEIAETLGIAPMRLGWIPKGMELDSYLIMEETGWVYINYLYQEELISIQMAKRTDEFSSNIQWDGNSRKLENVDNIYGYEIEAYCIDEEHRNYTASLTYGNGYYSIMGCFPDEKECLKILNQIYFKNV